jgi:glycosyltransferase involved in cell wall biosynthesis
MRGLTGPRTVVRIIDRLNVGGPAIHAVVTSSGLDPSRYRTLLVIGSVEPGEADMGDLLDGSGIEYVVIPSLGRELRPLRDLMTTWHLVRLLRRVRPDVVHTHKAKAGALGRLAALVAGVPVRVHTFHGHVFHGYFGPRKTSAFLAVERALARVTTRLVALSTSLVDELVGQYAIADASRFQVVPLGLPLERFAAARGDRRTLRDELKIADEPLVGIVGRMVPVKDHATFLAAAAELLRRRPEVRFVVVGGGELEANLHARAKDLGLTNSIHFTGWRRDLDRVYPALDVLALSSINEGTPVSLIEAMTAGIPVAATAVGGVSDLLRQGDWGELSPPRDPIALAAAIERALTPAARRRADRIRTQVRTAFGAERLCDDLMNLYDQLIDQQNNDKSST